MLSFNEVLTALMTIDDVQLLVAALGITILVARTLGWPLARKFLRSNGVENQIDSSYYVGIAKAFIYGIFFTPVALIAFAIFAHGRGATEQFGFLIYMILFLLSLPVIGTAVGHILNVRALLEKEKNPNSGTADTATLAPNHP